MNDHQSYIYHDSFLTFLGRLSSDYEDDIDELPEDELEEDYEDEDDDDDSYYYSSYGSWLGYFFSIYCCCLDADYGCSLGCSDSLLGLSSITLRLKSGLRITVLGPLS